MSSSHAPPLGGWGAPFKIVGAVFNKIGHFNLYPGYLSVHNCKRKNGFAQLRVGEGYVETIAAKGLRAGKHFRVVLKTHDQFIIIAQSNGHAAVKLVNKPAGIGI